MRQTILLLLVVLGHAAESPTFEVASVKPASPPAGRGMRYMQGGPGSSDPGRVKYTNMPIKTLILIAWDIKDFQLVGPGWLDSQNFDIEAKVPAGATKDQAKVMLQNLLIERFHLTVHHESKEMKVDELLVGKSGPKLKESAEDPNTAAPPIGPPPGPPKTNAQGFPQLDRPGMMVMMRMTNGNPVAHMVARAQPVSRLVNMLGFEMKHPVVDKTGLTGNYDFTLEYTPEGLPGGMMMGPPPGASPANGMTEAKDPGIAIAAALQQQLGLRLESTKAPVDILVIDQVDKTPTEN
jgi:uncharacterized protein (TIGR03435 family)